MKIFAYIAVCFVALSHFGFLVLEMFFWDHPVGREIFSLTEQQSADTALLAANQGLYNGFLGCRVAVGPNEEKARSHQLYSAMRYRGGNIRRAHGQIINFLYASATRGDSAHRDAAVAARDAFRPVELGVAGNSAGKLA